MAYGDDVGNAWAGQIARYLSRTVRLTFDGSGRSRRTEVVCWWVVTIVVEVVFNLVAIMFLPLITSTIIENLLLVIAFLLESALAIPVFALIVRRFHDQDRSGWWVLLFALPALFYVLILLSALSAISDNFSDNFSMLFFYVVIFFMYFPAPLLLLVLGIYALIVNIFLFLPGTIGPNRFSEDPR